MPAAHPYSLKGVLTNPLATMLPQFEFQNQVYRHGERTPPNGSMEGHAPSWECVSMSLAARDSSQVRVNLQRDFHLLALACSSSSIAAGGFRAQFYDTRKKLRMADRGVQFANIAGGNETIIGTKSNPFFLREPYVFDQPDSQLLVIVQNLETVTNSIQIVFYGQVLRFNEVSEAAEFPGGPVLSAWGD